MARRSRLKSKLLLFFVVFTTTTAAFWLGLVPHRISPFAPVDLALNEQWFLDPRLAALKRSPELCRKVLRAPFIAAKPIADRPIKDGCGWRNSVRMAEAGGARVPTGRLSCELAAAFAMWVTHVVQPAAEEVFGTRVKRIEQMGTYSCRNIIGNGKWRTVRSQHATANAIDISGFLLGNGRRIRVVKDWNDKGADGHFLRIIHQRSCRFFRVSLSPNFNAAHRDHFHFDRGFFKTCR